MSGWQAAGRNGKRRMAAAPGSLSIWLSTLAW